MRININHPETTIAKITIKADESELASAKSIALTKLASQVKVPGFRAGHVPATVVEKNIDSNVLQTEVLEQAFNNLYISAVRQEGLRPVDNPDISIKKFVPFTELEFEVTVPVIGDIKIADYKKIRIKKQPIKVVKKDIDEVVESLRQRAAERKEVERAVKKTDEVTIDFKGTDKDGKAIAGADGKDYPLIIGSGSFIPGFEDELIGLKPKQDKKFDITFPKDYPAVNLQNQEVTFDVSIKKINEMVKPEVDDNFAAAVGPFKNLDELRSDIEKQLGIEREREATANFENELLQKISDKSNIDIPKVLIDEQIDRIENEEKQNLIYQGQTWDEHLKQEGVTAEEHREQKRSAATERVKIGILLSEISDTEAVTATPEEIEVRLQIMKGQYRDKLAQTELEKPEALRDIETRIRTEKTMAKLTEYATSNK